MRTPRPTWLRVACSCILAGLAGCSGAPPGGGQSADGGTLPIHALQAIESPQSVLAYSVFWKTSEPADTRLDVACKGLETWTLSSPSVTTTHEVFVMGLVGGSTCTLTARASTSDAHASATKTIQVDALPGYLPKAAASTLGDPKALAPGWTLINLSNVSAGVPYTVAVVDEAGRYRWYLQYPGTSRSGGDTPVSRYRDGVLIGGRSVPMTYVTWQGVIQWTGPQGHHEARAATTPNRFYTLKEYKCPTFENAGDEIVEYDASTRTTSWTWRLCEHYKPPHDVLDWSHMNTVAEFPAKESLLGSVRDQNALVKIDRATGKLLWVMGYGGRMEDGFKGDFEMADADRFLRQHDATVLPNGHILMFDNGRKAVRQYSRALELAYTFDASGKSSARMVWQYRHKPDIFAEIWGGAQRLSNGNTLVTFGQQSGSPSTIVEASPSSVSVWELKVPEGWGIYRAQRITPPRGHVVAH